MMLRVISKDERRFGRNGFERKVIDGDPKERKHGDAHLCGLRSFASLGALSYSCFVLSANSAARNSTFSTDARYASASVGAPSAVALSRRNDSSAVSSLDVSEMWPGGASAAVALAPELSAAARKPAVALGVDALVSGVAPRKALVSHAVRTSCW